MVDTAPETTPESLITENTHTLGVKTLAGRAQGTFREIVLNRRDKRNAMTPEMLDQLLAALDRAFEAAIAGEIGALLLLGAGRVFCAGFDLKLAAADEAAIPELVQKLSEAVRKLRAFDVPTLVGVQGAAVAGGCALLCGTDFVIADQEATFGYPVHRIGVSPAVSVPTLSQIIGTGDARLLTLSGELINAHEAKRIGLVSKVVSDAADVLPRSQLEAAALAAKPREAVKATKQWLREVTDGNLAKQSKAGLDATLSVTGSAFEREALKKMFDT